MADKKDATERVRKAGVSPVVFITAGTAVFRSQTAAITIDPVRNHVYNSAVWVRQSLFVLQRSWPVGSSKLPDNWGFPRDSSFASIWKRRGRWTGAERSSC